MNITLSNKYKEMFKDNPNIFFYFLYGGRCGSKTFSAMTYVIYRMINARETCVYCQQTKADLNTSAINEWENRLKDMNLWGQFKRVGNRYTYIPNGSTIVFKGFQTSSEAVEAMKGFSNLSIAYVDEAQSTDEEAFDNLIGSIRAKKDMKLIVSLNPSHKECYLYKRYFKDLPSEDFSGIIDDKLYVYSSYEDVKQYIGESKIKVIENLKLTDPVKFQNQYLGKWISNIESPLLSKQLLDLAINKIEIPNEFDKIVVSIDPAISVNKNSDATGLSVCAKKDKDYYILECIEEKLSPNEWALKAFELYKQYNADNIVVEVNQGGDMCEQVLRQVCGTFIKIDKVRATKGKVLRFDPVHALYEQQLIHHCGRFADLELQELTFSGNEKDKSPNSVDSMVWGITYLAQHGKNSVGFC